MMLADMLKVKFVISLLVLLVLPVKVLASSCGRDDIPPGAQSLHYFRTIIDEVPRASEISSDGNGDFKYYNGQWWSKYRPQLTSYFDTDQGLAITLGGSLSTVSPDDFHGVLPALSGRRGFYIEFESRLDSSNIDHWPALWMLAKEHRGKTVQEKTTSTPNIEYWMELDIDEGGFTSGMLGTVHSWQGIWPKFSSIHNPVMQPATPLDRTACHVFGASFDPAKLLVTWWLDGIKQNQASFPSVPEVAREQSFYLLFGAQTHGKHIPYKMYVERIRALVP